jgi:hypothetical protein
MTVGVVIIVGVVMAVEDVITVGVMTLVVVRVAFICWD